MATTACGKAVRPHSFSFKNRSLANRKCAAFRRGIRAGEKRRRRGAVLRRQPDRGGRFPQHVVRRAILRVALLQKNRRGKELPGVAEFSCIFFKNVILIDHRYSAKVSYDTGHRVQWLRKQRGLVSRTIDCHFDLAVTFQDLRLCRTDREIRMGREMGGQMLGGGIITGSHEMVWDHISQ